MILKKGYNLLFSTIARKGVFHFVEPDRFFYVRVVVRI